MRSYKIEAAPPNSAGTGGTGGTGGQGVGQRGKGRQENTDITTQIIENTKTGRFGVFGN